MNKLSKSLLWLYMLNKRLYKKPSFVAILLSIVVLSLCFSLFAGDDSSILRVALCSDGGDISGFADSIIAEESIISYGLFPSRGDALHALEAKGYDCVWVLPADIPSAAMDYAENGRPIAELIQREDSVFLRLARERLYAALYPYISKAVYRDFIGDSLGDATQNDIDKFYDKQATRGELVNLSFINSADNVADSNMVLEPVRGLLAVAIFLGAYSALMNFKKDRVSGLYSRIGEDKHIYLGMINIFLAAANAAAFSLIAFAICGISSGILTEIALILIYIALAVLFCALIGELFESVNVLGALMPILVIVMLAVCPIFLNMKSIRSLAFLLPPYYYLMLQSDSSYFIHALLYAAFLGISIFAVRSLKRLYKKRL